MSQLGHQRRFDVGGVVRYCSDRYQNVASRRTSKGARALNRCAIASRGGRRDCECSDQGGIVDSGRGVLS